VQLGRSVGVAGVGEFDFVARGHAVESLAVDAEDLGGALAVVAGRVEDVEDVTSLDFVQIRQTRKQLLEIFQTRREILAQSLVVTRRGFAARCEAGLCPAVNSNYSIAAMPPVRGTAPFEILSRVPAGQSPASHVCRACSTARR
jgi:hypothetical protein